MATGTSIQLDGPRWSISDFPPLLCADSERHPHNSGGSLQPKMTSPNGVFMDRKNDSKSAVSTSLGIRITKLGKKFRPADNLWCFSFDTVSNDHFVGNHFSGGVTMASLRELEEMYTECCLPDRIDYKRRSRNSKGKYCRTIYDYWLREKLDVPRAKARGRVNFRVVSKLDKQFAAISNGTDNRRNKNKKMATTGLKQADGNENCSMDIDALNATMPQTATQQRARRNRRNAIKNNKESKSDKKAVRPSSLVRERRKVRWKTGAGNTNQARSSFELHHDNISSLQPDIKNEDDLWQLMNIQHRELTPEDYDLLLQLDESVAPKTVSQEALTNLRVATVDALGLEGGLAGQVCSICIEDYAIGQKVKYLPCGHFYHEQCIDNWLTYCDRKCPLDGYEIS